ncbi:hypothetical protein PVAP13_5NG221881 [Panicum virgatum]|uniref:Uncharacterized protein n=1 Tax=Panicum virgatum TaxID=38727 RepID=A0A8T0RV04_PANVG|nr:hypothetical protein PVAP13_5NG221881 [Panicum virgatum]
MKIACRDVLAIPKTTESTLGMFIYDFHFELEDQLTSGGAKHMSGVKIIEHDGQPSPKKQKMDQSKMGPRAPKEGPSVFDGKVSEAKHTQKKGDADELLERLVRSAPDKVMACGGDMNDEISSTRDMEMEEAIPAATYEPSHSSEKYFQIQVKKIWDDEGESSQRRDNVRLSRCELSGLQKDVIFNVGYNQILKSKVKISEIPKKGGLVSKDTQYMDDSIPADLDVSKIKNPCDDLRKAREERRWSERLHKQVEDNVVIPEVVVGQKQSSEGNNTNQNSFSILSENGIIARSNIMGVKLLIMILPL